MASLVLGERERGVSGPESLLVIGLCVGIPLLRGFTRLQILLAASFFGMFLLPTVVYGGTPLDADWVGIAGAAPRIMTYTVAVGIVLAYVVSTRGSSPSWGPVLPLVAYLLVWYGAFWTHSSKVNAGLLHLLTGAAAWGAGAAISRLALRRPNGMRVVATWVLGWTALESIVCVAQLVGIPIFPLASGPTEDATLAGRIGGTLGHPSTIGKVIFFLLMMTLPWLNSDDQVLRRRASLAMTAMIIPMSLSGGRANAAAALALVILTLALEPGPRRWSRRIRLGAVLAVAAILSAGYWVQRFETGERGETRSHLTSVALDYMAHHWDWVTGSGPNTYVGAVGPFDPLTAVGWPVHNFYLLAAVEIGLIGAFLLSWPPLSAALVGWRARKQPGTSGAQARVLLAATPGVVMITTTGWGMMSTTLPAWFFSLGFCIDQVARPSRLRAHLRSAYPAQRALARPEVMHLEPSRDYRTASEVRTDSRKTP